MARKKPRLLVLASGTENGGGSGFQSLVASCQDGVLAADLVGVISNHANGGVAKRAIVSHVPFGHFQEPYTAKRYLSFVTKFRADFVALSGWLKHVKGLDSKTTFNIHPGPPEFGGSGMYGHHVHEAVLKAFLRGKIAHSAVIMHFVTDEYDKGPIFFYCPVPIVTGDTAQTLGQRVNGFEHNFQALVTDLVVSGQISWDGKDPRSLVVPKGYLYLPPLL